MNPVGAVCAFLLALVATPAGVSGAVLLLPIQLSVLHVPSPAVTPTNLLFNVAAVPGGLLRDLVALARGRDRRRDLRRGRRHLPGPSDHARWRDRARSERSLALVESSAAISARDSRA